jgi:DNA-binding NarL/FixJ family response regulator
MGMARLRDRTHRELVLAGGRPRRTRATGPQSLTAAQQQVARLAVAGRSNRQIAEELFVTIKTVETHLAAVYRKLGIAARVQLVDMLGGADEAPWAAASATVGP